LGSSDPSRFELPGGLSPQEEAAVLAALEQYFVDTEPSTPDAWTMAGRLDATGMGALQARHAGTGGWRSAVRNTFARTGVPPFHGRGDAG
jgi:hypothetical protein